MAGLTMGDWQLLPPVPMLGFLLLLKLSYFGAFTAACGQTIGKMAAHIRVVADDAPLDPSRAIRRTMMSAVSLLALGAGFIPALLDPDHRALHDRDGAHPRRGTTIGLSQRDSWSGLSSLAKGIPRTCAVLAVFLATCGYVGYAPVAPGTFGSAAGLAIFALVRSQRLDVIVELATIVVLFAVGVWSGTEAEHHFGGVDPGPIVLDEVVGMLITLALLPVNVDGRDRWLPRLPRPRCRQAVAVGSLRAPARRPGRDGRRRHGGGVRQRRDARSLIAVAPAGWLS